MSEPTITAELVIHLEDTDGGIVWWAESPDAPGLSAAAPTLARLRTLAVEALTELCGRVSIRERLVGRPVTDVFVTDVLGN